MLSVIIKQTDDLYGVTLCGVWRGGEEHAEDKEDTFNRF